MTTWRVLLRGADFPLAGQGGALFGFYATRWVEAEDEKGAFAAAVKQLRAASELADVPQGCGAQINAEEITELSPGRVAVDRTGLTFFRMATSSATRSESECTT